MLLTIFLLIVCSLVAVAGVPLILRLVPQNPVYGVPTEKTLSNKEAWFEVSAFGGAAILIAAAVSGLLLMMYNGTWLRSGWAQLAAFIIPIGAAVAATLAFERRFVPKGEARDD